MGRKITRTSRARLDLIEIWQFIADDNETAADRFLDRIEEALAILGDNPHAVDQHPLGRELING